MTTIASALPSGSLATGGAEGNDHPALRRAGRILLSLFVGLLSTTTIWWLFVKFGGTEPLVTKSPGDVWAYLFTDPEAATNRSLIFSELRTTLRDAMLGYVAGTIAAILVASLFVLRRGFEATVMPVAMLLRSVPLVAMVPVITLVFGRDILAITLITGIITFFPSLVNITFGLRAVPKQGVDLMRAYGAGPGRTLRTLRLPYAVPSMFAAMRIAVPGAIIGALLSEWLATGKGLGYLMLKAQSTFDYTGIWAAVAVITFTALTLYALVGLIETPVLARFDPERLKEGSGA
jgi:ABC-type nitrate/sulfonate/bicarbonate transport system permease component